MKRKVIVIVVIIVLMILLIPIPMRYKDGGTVRYKAILYDVTKYHVLSLDSEKETETEYREGWKIKIVGITIYNSYD